jgi:hypothetical protein
MLPGLDLNEPLSASGADVDRGESRNPQIALNVREDRLAFPS